MEIWYQGTNIASSVLLRSCIYRDESHGRADTLEISFYRTTAWHRWNPVTDDTIQVKDGKFDTGKLYVNTIVSEGNKYQIFASSLPSKAKRKAWDFYQDMSLKEIMHRCAAECGMSDGLYGVDGSIRYKYLIRKNEGCAAFLERLARCEGIALKAWNGMFRGIGIEYAQALAPTRNWSINTDNNYARYQHQSGRKITSLTVKSPWAEATARDSGADAGSQMTDGTLPVMDAVQAGRWARGLLLFHNRESDKLTIEMKLDSGVTAMARATITGNTGANGEWMIDEAEHDLYNGRTTARLLRVIKTVK